MTIYIIVDAHPDGDGHPHKPEFFLRLRTAKRALAAYKGEDAYANQYLEIAKLKLANIEH